MNDNLDLSYANALTLLIPPYDSVALVLIGCGGTGSWLAPAVARVGKLLQNTTDVRVHFIDPDRVEEKNTIRQNFCQAEVGLSKAQALAMRYSAAWGLPIQYHVTQFETGWEQAANLRILIGCVDNTEARKAIRKEFKDNPLGRHWWLDCGNEKSYGQILLGGGDPHEKYAYKLPGFCSGLPLPSDQHPELVEENPAPEVPELSCAEMAMADSQGLAINQRVAAEAADYLVRMLITRDLKKYATYMDLESGTTRSKYISRDLFTGVVE